VYALHRTIKTNIRDLRQQEGWSYTDMGRILGMSRGAACLLEKSNGRVMLEHVYALAQAAHVPASMLLP
jgi:transcriptional regulator with XRE-family HTH domain